MRCLETREERRDERRGEKWGEERSGETTLHHDEDIGPPSIFHGPFQGHPIIPKTFSVSCVKKMKKTTPKTRISSEQFQTYGNKKCPNTYTVPTENN